MEERLIISNVRRLGSLPLIFLYTILETVRRGLVATPFSTLIVGLRPSPSNNRNVFSFHRSSSAFLESGTERSDVLGNLFGIIGGSLEPPSGATRLFCPVSNRIELSAQLLDLMRSSKALSLRLRPLLPRTEGRYSEVRQEESPLSKVCFYVKTDRRNRLHYRLCSKHEHCARDETNSDEGKVRWFQEIVEANHLQRPLQSLVFRLTRPHALLHARTVGLLRSFLALLGTLLHAVRPVSSHQLRLSLVFTLPRS